MHIRSHTNTEIRRVSRHTRQRHIIAAYIPPRACEVRRVCGGPHHADVHVVIAAAPRLRRRHQRGAIPRQAVVVRRNQVPRDGRGHVAVHEVLEPEQKQEREHNARFTSARYSSSGVDNAGIPHLSRATARSTENKAQSTKRGKERSTPGSRCAPSTPRHASRCTCSCPRWPTAAFPSALPGSTTSCRGTDHAHRTFVHRRSDARKHTHEHVCTAVTL
jgi:hypothetical protein